MLARPVQGLAQVARPSTLDHEIVIERIIELTRQHLFAFRAHGG
jgi:hypothetical protein